MAHRLVEGIGFVVEDADVVPGLGQAGIQLERAPAFGHRLFGVPGLAMHFAEVAAPKRDGAVGLDGAGHPVDGGAQAPGLMMDHAQQVHGRGMPAVGAQDVLA